MRIAPALLVTVVIAGAAPARDSQVVPPATPIGPAVSCLQHSLIDEGIVRSNRVIDFRVLGSRYYRNVLPQDCAGLGVERRFGFTTPTSKLCATDIITVVSTASIVPGNSCRLGRFQPVTLGRR